MDKLEPSTIKILLTAQKEAAKTTGTISCGELALALLVEDVVPLTVKDRHEAQYLRSELSRLQQEQPQPAVSVLLGDRSLMAKLMSTITGPTVSWSDSAKESLERAWKLAHERGTDVLTPQHLLLAVIESGDSCSSNLMDFARADFALIRSETK